MFEPTGKSKHSDHTQTLLGYMQGVLLLLTFLIGTLVGIFVLIYVYRASKAGLFNPPATAAQPATIGTGDSQSAVQNRSDHTSRFQDRAAGTNDNLESART